jgi:hypothetical protein
VALFMPDCLLHAVEFLVCWWSEGQAAERSVSVLTHLLWLQSNLCPSLAAGGLLKYHDPGPHTTWGTP